MPNQAIFRVFNAESADLTDFGVSISWELSNRRRHPAVKLNSSSDQHLHGGVALSLIVRTPNRYGGVIQIGANSPYVNAVKHHGKYAVWETGK
jgi:hypothetical protein